MKNTFIKNEGFSKTIIHNNNNNKNYFNEINWKGNYDGDKAKISLNINDNGMKEHYAFKMNNSELSELLNIPSIDEPIDKRLYNDFLGNRKKKLNDSNMIVIYKNPQKINKEDTFLEPNEIGEMDKSEDLIKSIQQIFSGPEKFTHISSPLTSENLLFPLKIRETRKRRKRRHSNKFLGTYRKSSRPRTHKKNKTSHSSTYSRRTF